MAGIFDVVESTEGAGRRENAQPTGGSGRDLSAPADLRKGHFKGDKNHLEQPSSSSRV